MKKSTSRNVWAIGKKNSSVKTTDPIRTKPVKVQELLQKGQERIIRYQQGGVIPIMEKPTIVRPEDHFQSANQEVEIQPLKAPRAINTPLWLDPSRYGDLDFYTHEDMKRARQRGYESLAQEHGYSTASLNTDSASRNRLIAETPDLLEQVDAIMTKYIKGYIPNGEI